MKILFVSHSAELAGAERSLLELVRVAAQRGHVGTVTIPQQGPLAKAIEDLGVPFKVEVVRTRIWMGARFWFPVSLIRLIQSVADTKQFSRMISGDNFDIVACNSSVMPAPMIAASSSHIPSVLMLRESVRTNPMLKSFLPKWLILLLIRRSFSEILAISAYVADQLGGNPTVVPPQVNHRFLEYRPDFSNENEDAALNAVMIGTLSAEKGQMDAVEAIAAAYAGGASVRLDIYGVGSDSFTRRLHRKVRRLKMDSIIEIHGATSNAMSIFARADLTLICSKNEAFGKTSVESVLVGTPVLGYASGATPDIINERLGFLVEANPAALACELTSLSQQRWRLAMLPLEAEVTKLRQDLQTSADRVLDAIESTAGRI